MIVLTVTSFLSPPVLAELVQANLITSEECEELYDPSDVVEVQSGKSPEVLTKTAEVLLRHGLEEESNLLAGKQTQPLIHVPVVCCTVEPSCKGLGKELEKSLSDGADTGGADRYFMDNLARVRNHPLLSAHQARGLFTSQALVSW